MTLLRSLLALGASMALAGGALAQSPGLDQALARGVAGERYDGYMGLAGPASAALRSQVGAINIKRRSLYSSLAAQRGVSPNDVGLTAGCRLLARVSVGEAYLLADGQWRRRTGVASVAPAYC